MVNNYILDSNMLISFLNEKDNNHTKASDIFRSIVGANNRNIYIAKVSIYECMVILSRSGYSMSQLKDIFFYLGSNYKIVDLSEVASFRHIDNLLNKENINNNEILRTNDFIISSIAIDFDAKLVTFDEKMKGKISKIYPELIYNFK